MTRIAWNAVGERIFETGVDRGVLYVIGVGFDGVPWNGLVSVSESPTGGEVTPYYIDGIKYLNHSASEEFEATIEAFTYPDIFAVCEGTVQMGLGLYASQQPRKPFNLAYRTLVGNDEQGTDHGYKIHLVYGATVEPSSRSNESVGETISPQNFSWNIKTKPPIVTGLKPASHFIIDSREVPSEILTQFEDILYGTASSQPRMPSVQELLYIFEEQEVGMFDGGTLDDDEYFNEFDGGNVGDSYDSILDGGGA